MKTPKVKISAPSGRCLVVWYMCPESGRKVRIGTRSHDRRVAEEMRDEIQARLELGLSPTKQKLDGVSPVTWEEFRDAYAMQRVMRPDSGVDMDSRLDIAERIIKPRELTDMANRRALNKLQSELFAGKESRFNRPRATATVRSYMKSVIAALNWAKEQGFIDDVPQITIASMEEEDDMKGRPLVGEEVDRFLMSVPKVVGDLAAPSWEYLIRGVIASGLRLGELMDISWDIPQTIQPRYRPGRRPTLWLPHYMQKNKKTQEIPLCPWFDGLLQEIPENERTGWVFNPMSLDVQLGRKPRTERLSAQHVGKVLTRIGKRSGVIVDEGNPRTGSPAKYASCHDLRRTFAQNLADNNVPAKLTSKLMRHADERTTARYYQVPNVQKEAGELWQILGHSVTRPSESETDTKSLRHKKYTPEDSNL